MVLLKNDRDALPLGGARAALDRRHRPLRRRRRLHQRRLVGRDVGCRRRGHAAGRHPRAGRVGRDASPPRKGSLGDVPLPTIVPGDAPGFAATYWNNGDFDGAPALTRVDPTIDLAAAPDRRRAAVVGALDRHAHAGASRGCTASRCCRPGSRRCASTASSSDPATARASQFLAGPRYPMQGAVRADGRRAGADPRRVLELGAALRRPGPPRLAAAVGLAASPAAVAGRARADVAIVFVNDVTGEGMDRTTLALPGDQDQLIDAVAAANPRTIVVLHTGGPVLMPWLDDVERGARRPGTRASRSASAIASVLFGDRDPGGRLPMTFPRQRRAGPGDRRAAAALPGRQRRAALRRGHLRRLPLVRRVRPGPLFPFGYGLSYTTFRFGDLQVKADHGSVRRVHAVTNTSRRAGSTVVQVYVSFPRRPASRRASSRATRRSSSGQAQRGRQLRLDPADLAYYDERREPDDRRRALHAVGRHIVARPRR